MAIDFPSGPANNDIYVDPITGNRYIWNSVFAYWAAASSTGDSATVGGNTASDLNTYADNKAANAYSNAVSYTDTKIGTANSAITSNAATAYSNAVSYTDSRIIDSVTNTSIAYAASANSVKNAYDRAIDANTRAASAQSAASAAYSNAVSYTDTKISTANTAMVANAATAYSNAVAYTDTKIGTANTAMVANASTAYTNAVAYVDSKSFVNTTQLSSNLSNYAALSGASFTGAVIVSNNLTVTGNLTLSGNTLIVGANNLVVSDAIISLHTPANLASLTSNDGKNIGLAFHYYDTEDKHALLYRDNSTGRLQYHNDGSDPLTNSNPTGNNLGIIQANSFWSGNDSVFATTNSTIYTGTANNTSFVGSVSAANVVSNAQLSANLANYQTTAGLAANVAVLASNSATFLGGSGNFGNATGIYTSGVVNAATVQVGTSVVANSTRFVVGTAVGLQANGTIGTAGQVLHSNGTTVYWDTDDQGVTSVATGSGLTGGTITATGTVSVLANTGIVANATGLYVNSAYINTLSANNTTFINGNNVLTVMESLRANRSLHGGGTITVDGSGNILWSARFIVISNGRGTHFGTSGYFDINCPTSGTITGVGGATNKTATAAGIPLAAWEALYYIMPIGGGPSSLNANFRVVSYTSDLEIPSDWLLICVCNGDNNNYYFNNGIIIKAGQSYVGGSHTSTVIGSNTFTVGTASYFVANGNVGIGTTSPSDKLHVSGGNLRLDNNRSLRFANVAGTGTTSFTHQSDDNFVAYNAAGAPTFSFTAAASPVAVYGANANNRMFVDAFSNTIYWTVGNTERMRIVANGNLGIGTSSPGNKLQVTGGYIAQQQTDGSLARISLINTNRNWSLSNYGSAFSPTGSFHIADETAGLVRFSIDSGGNTGIGVASPNARLQVEGTANVSGNVAFGGTVSKTDVEDRYISNTTASTTQTAIDSFSATTYRSAKYIIQATNSTSYHYTEVAIVHDGTTAYATEFATMFTGASLVSFAVDINTGNVRLLATATNATTTTYKIDRKLIKV